MNTRFKVATTALPWPMNWETASVKEAIKIPERCGVMERGQCAYLEQLLQIS